ncbi:putative solute-binding protein family 5 [Septoria linicola]|nr:putative solute-binding protein family 5 [Septoria linicola]
MLGTFADTNFSFEGSTTVRVESKEPFGDLPQIFNDFWPSRLADDGKPVLGTGPYRVQEFSRSDGRGSATLELVDDTARPDAPRVITAIHEPNGEKRLQLLRDDVVDVTLNLERADNLDLLDLAPPLQWERVTSTLSVMYYCNCFSGIFTDPGARLAANLAIDNNELVRQVYKGFALPSGTAVSPVHLGFTQAGLSPVPYDPSAARALLKEFDLIEPITLRTPEYMPEHAEKISAFVASALTEVGFRVNIELETNRPEYARSIGLRKQVGDLALFDSTPNTTFRVLDDKVSSANNATWWLGYHDAEFQRLFAEVKGTVADAARGQAYAKCLQRVQQNPPWLYVAHPEVTWATGPGVSVHIGASGVLSLT